MMFPLPRAALKKLWAKLKFHNMDSMKPIVAIVGTTGTGKSKLAIEIAKKYNGEVINADAMQMYQGLNIVTNKVTESEQEQVKHHLIGVVNPLMSFSVVNFRSMCLHIIKKLHDANKLPVIVGGTHYYVEAILYENSIVAEISESESYVNPGKSVIKERLNMSEGIVSEFHSGKWSVHPNCDKKLAKHIVSKLMASAEEDVDLYSELLKLDPKQASKLHTNDKRKIYRALEIWLQTGMIMSEHLSLQKSQVREMDKPGTIRFPNTVLLWINCDKEVLLKRLGNRVDQMIENGLVDELKCFHESYNQKLFKDNNFAHYERGIFQSIGFKEFHDFLILPKEEQDSETGKELFRRNIKFMKTRTNQYAKYQLKFIKRSLASRTKMALPYYKIDATDFSKWRETVTPVADDIVASLLTNTKSNIEPIQCSHEERDTALANSDKTKYYCEVCCREIIGHLQWNYHMNGKKHYRMLKEKQILERDKEVNCDNTVVERPISKAISDIVSKEPCLNKSEDSSLMQKPQ